MGIANSLVMMTVLMMMKMMMIVTVLMLMMMIVWLRALPVSIVAPSACQVATRKAEEQCSQELGIRLKS